MNATTEPPKSSAFVAFSWASAMTSPIACSPEGEVNPFGARAERMVAVILPITRLAIGSDSDL